MSHTGQLPLFETFPASLAKVTKLKAKVLKASPVVEDEPTSFKHTKSQASPGYQNREVLNIFLRCCCTTNLSIEYHKMHKHPSIDQPERKQGMKLIIHCLLLFMIDNSSYPFPLPISLPIVVFCSAYFFMSLTLYSLTLHCL